MMIPEKRRISTIILSKMNDGKMASDVQAKPESGPPEEKPLDIICQDLLRAINEKSIMGIKDALGAFIEEHGLSSKDEPEESEG